MNKIMLYNISTQIKGSNYIIIHWSRLT